MHGMTDTCHPRLRGSAVFSVCGGWLHNEMMHFLLTAAVSFTAASSLMLGLEHITLCTGPCPVSFEFSGQPQWCQVTAVAANILCLVK